MIKYVEELSIQEVMTSQTIYSSDSWYDTASKAIDLADEHGNYARFLPVYNRENWGLDYPQQGEDRAEYTARLVDMAIGLQLIG